ncbi:fibronectin type III domain-containing protein [Microbulbifer bruguierae]|uniref:Fibronectin type III domain-containing protein n=1 Tax=Microbulbifer bruguierae TaxID=3029061 RepID=A0ABY8NDF5_9GAMM|nr:fibronectin type III domain-containing protein [Microbulbifer bruguierae]WGL15782.1 fibronectin type III domain-containing protein [Microbulbifer bruguierae]
MKPLPWVKSTLALCIMGTLTACGGGGADANNQGDIVHIEPPTTEPPVEEPSGIVNTPLPFHENFGDGVISNFDEADTQFFLSPDYKKLQTAQDNPEYEDSYPSMWYPTCCFFVDEKNPDPNDTEIVLEELGIASDNGNPSLVLGNARLTLGQTQSELANPEAKTAGNTDRKKDSSAGDATAASGSWGEFDLSEPYRVSFCVKAVNGGAGSVLLYVDSNHSNTNTGTSIHSNPLILNAGTPSLVPGERVVINVPGDTTFSTGGAIANQITDQIGSKTSFLQFRVPSDGGAQIIIDDLLIEKQSDDGQASLPACNTFEAAEPPAAPETAPTVGVRDAALAVNWEAVAGSTGYELAWNTTGETPTEANATDLTGSAYLINELENGTAYYVFLRALNSAGASDWSPAATATPEAPSGCSPTTAVNTTINWSVWDGCAAPQETGSVVVNGSEAQQFSVSEDVQTYFSSNDDGTTTLKTTDESGVDAGVSANADMSGVMDDSTAGYPRYFTWIGRINTPNAGVRGFEVEISFGEADGRRVKAILRPDNDAMQLERFFDQSSSSGTAQADVALADGFHIYHLVFALNAASDVTAKVYRDGENISDLFTDAEDGVVDVEITGTGRDGGSSSPRLRMGDGSSSNPYEATIDWLIWSDDATVAGYEPADLVGQLPDTIGELGAYAGEGQSEPAAVLSDNFDSATDGDGSSSSLFTAAYKSISSDASKPFYNANNGASRVVVSGGAIQFHNARFTLGDPLAADKTTTADDTITRGDIDLSKPYRISFDVTVNDNADDGTGKCQVYIDNDGTSSGNSIHGGDSKIFEANVLEISNGLATGPVVIESDIGTATSFIQFRCDSGVEEATPLTIDNLVIEYQ